MGEGLGYGTMPTGGDATKGGVTTRSRGRGRVKAQGMCGQGSRPIGHAGRGGTTGMQGQGQG